jgi:predicted nucleotidyltransferase component of viral defense system
MKLHNDKESFRELIAVTADYFGIPQTAVKRDYYIVMLLQNLQNSDYADLAVFKGGTSLSKCYPGSINRFSEDIDLTYIPNDEMTRKQYDKVLNNMEKAIIGSAQYEKIPEERNDRNKSAYVWFEIEDRTNGRIKLEIGSSVKPEPYCRRSLKTSIQEYLENNDMPDVVVEYELEPGAVNVLNIERTFIDKIFAVKRHAICGTLNQKVRHIYDVTQLLCMPDIQEFLLDSDGLKVIVSKTKETDSFYLEKRNISKDYDPLGAYDFPSWQDLFDDSIRQRYESLHMDLLYTNEKQDFDDAIAAFDCISATFAEIGE